LRKIGSHSHTTLARMEKNPPTLALVSAACLLVGLSVIFALPGYGDGDDDDDDNDVDDNQIG